MSSQMVRGGSEGSNFPLRMARVAAFAAVATLATFVWADDGASATVPGGSGDNATPDNGGGLGGNGAPITLNGSGSVTGSGGGGGGGINNRGGNGGFANVTATVGTNPIAASANANGGEGGSTFWGGSLGNGGDGGDANAVVSNACFNGAANGVAFARAVAGRGGTGTLAGHSGFATATASGYRTDGGALEVSAAVVAGTGGTGAFNGGSGTDGHSASLVNAVDGYVSGTQGPRTLTFNESAQAGHAGANGDTTSNLASTGSWGAAGLAGDATASLDRTSTHNELYYGANILAIAGNGVNASGLTIVPDGGTALSNAKLTASGATDVATHSSAQAGNGGAGFDVLFDNEMTESGYVNVESPGGGSGGSANASATSISVNGLSSAYSNARGGDGGYHPTRGGDGGSATAFSYAFSAANTALANAIAIPGADAPGSVAGLATAEAIATSNGFTVTVLDSGRHTVGVQAIAYPSLTGSIITNGNLVAVGSGTTTTNYLMSGGSLTASDNLTVNGGSTFSISGGVASTPSTVNNGSTSISGGTISLGAVSHASSTAGALSISGGSVSANSIRQNSLAISGNSRVTVAGNGSNTGVSRVNSLSVAPSSGATLDLSDNDLIVDYSGTSPLGSLSTSNSIIWNLAHAYIASNGAWTGSGITSLVAAANSSTYALGYGEASSIFGSSGGNFDGEAVDGTTALIKFTYAGDVNLDGKVDVVDSGIISSHWQATGASWTDGDLNYDGLVNVVDLGILSSTWQDGVSNGQPLVAHVPEPASFLAIASSLMIGFSRRRRS